jgi:hypothetical protein
MVKFLNVTVPIITLTPEMLPAVPAQSMVRVLLITAPVDVLLLSAQASSSKGKARAVAVSSEHGAVCVHTEPDPEPEKKSLAAVAGSASKKTMIAHASSDVMMLETFMASLLDEV